MNDQTRVYSAMVVIIIMITIISIPLVYGEEKIVLIPERASDPSFDPQFPKPIEWYIPSNLKIRVGDTVTWVNNDTVQHTITSGKGVSRYEGVTGKLGVADGIFDSGLIGRGESWSYKFEKPGRFAYFCAVHPWMIGVVIVEQQIPDYPHDANGNRVTFPIMTVTPDRRYHVGITWAPSIITTGERIAFINDFFDISGTIKQHLLNYYFVLYQNGREIYRSLGYSERGSDIKYYVFSEPGPIIIRFEEIGGSPDSNVEFSTIVYGEVYEVSDIDKALISSAKMDTMVIHAITYAGMTSLVIGAGLILWWFRRKL
ncbi:MAG: plastocyanin/azurin family copper-binding protein [Candidatus Nitrosocaldus sp.]